MQSDSLGQNLCGLLLRKEAALSCSKTKLKDDGRGIKPINTKY
jgi:hypothetical protein